MQRKSVFYSVAALAILVVLLTTALMVSAEKGEPPGALPNSLSISGGALPPAGPIRISPPQNPEALINDGSFENGPPPGSAWTEVTNVGCEWIGDWSAAWGVPAHDGSIDFWAGGYCSGVPATSSVSQAGIAVPATDNDLHFWYIAYRPDPDDADPDTAYVKVNGTGVWTLALTQATSTYPNWVEVVLPMTAYAGQNVTLEFSAVSAGTATGNIRYDYISFGAPPPPPERCPAGSQEVTVLTQDFTGSFPPAGWVVANTTTGCVAPGVPDWTNTDPGARGNLTGGSGAFAIADSDVCGSSSVMNAQMWSAPINLTGLTDPQVTYYTDYYDISSTSDVADLDFSVNGGTTWTNLISWNSSHRGPLMVEQPFAANNQASVLLRWNYTNATWDWWWEVDSVEVTACEPNNPAIELNKTVGTTPGVCAVGDNITVTAGTEVYYCYQAHNTGDVALNFHDLTDSELGVLADNLPYALAPGAYSPQVIVPDTPMATVTNVGTWTAVSALAGYAVDDTIPYNFQDIAGTGTAIPLTDDSMSGAIPLGFALDYFGTNYSDVYVSSNGFLTVLSGQSNGCCTGQPIPTAGDPDGVIAGWWEDLNPSAGGTVHYQTLGAAPNRVFIVQFTNVPHYSSGNDVTMQFKLFETTNVIEVHYQAAPSDGGMHSAGIENADGSAGVQWTYGTASLTTPEAVQYAPTPVYSATDTDTATVTVLTPNINVNPLSLSSTQPVDTSWVLPMTVANTGQGNLTWQIAEEPVARPPEQLRGGDALTAADTFDGKMPQKPAGVAPELSNWRAPEAVLYDNGPLVTNPGAGAGGADASALQTALGLGTYGVGNQVVAGNRVADDFTVGGSGWLIGNITFFGYQTGSTTTSTFTAVNLRIWDGPPNVGTSMVVFGDTTTNRLVSSTWSNIYRVLDTGLLDTGRPVMANVVAINTFLPAGTYWLDWQADGTLASGPWAPPVSILGQTGKPGANALQYTSTGWAAVTDPSPGGTPQDLPFIVDGLADCSNLSDVPWLSASPTSGTNTGGTSTPVNVTINTTGLALGTYEARLCVTSNDPTPGPGNGTNLVIVPVTLEVANLCPAGPVTGALTTTDPTFNRPVSGNPGCFPDPYVGTHVRYDVYPFYLNGAPPQDLWASLCGSTAFDSVLIVYQAPAGTASPFNPAQPCTNAVAYDDDWCGSQPLIDQATFGTGWIDIVVAGYANDGMGPYTLNLDSNSCNGGAAQINVSPLTVNNGQTCMNQNTQVSQPMAVQNVGNRPLYTWAADSANAGCASISDVRWLRLPEASFATAAGATSSVDVTFDSTGYAPGVYTANVCFSSNDPDAAPGNGTGMVVVPATMTVCTVPTAVDLSSLAAAPVQSPLPVGIPLAALPAAAGLALAAAYAVRRKK